MKYETQYDVSTIVAFKEEGFEVIGVDFTDCSSTKRIIRYDDKRMIAFFSF